jgi:hypothetical protein
MNAKLRVAVIFLTMTGPVWSASSNGTCLVVGSHEIMKPNIDPHQYNDLATQNDKDAFHKRIESALRSEIVSAAEAELLAKYGIVISDQDVIVAFDKDSSGSPSPAALQASPNPQIEQNLALLKADLSYLQSGESSDTYYNRNLASKYSKADWDAIVSACNTTTCASNSIAYAKKQLAVTKVIVDKLAYRGSVVDKALHQLADKELRRQDPEYLRLSQMAPDDPAITNALITLDNRYHQSFFEPYFIVMQDLWIKRELSKIEITILDHDFDDLKNIFSDQSR